MPTGDMSLIFAKRLVLGLLIGGALGFGWHKLVGCRTGSCPLTATPLRGVLYGAVVGTLWALASRPLP